jgi:hypothetical protein
LYLNDNQLSGSLPPELYNIPVLRALYLNNNQLSGNIPPEFGKFPSMYDLHLGNNQLTGIIPPELGNLSNLGSLTLNNNQLTGTIPPELGNRSRLYLLDLSNNQLTGKIPPELGRRFKLVILKLDHNKLRGNIPATFTTRLHLDSLDLSHNHFTFDGMELVAQTFPFAKYHVQEKLTPHINGNAISVSAGGTLSNNTYSWIRQGQADTVMITGDSVFHPTESGVYFVTVKNKIAYKLDLCSDTISYTAPVAINAVAALADQNTSNNGFTVYPNPAKNVLNIYTGSSASFSLLDESGKILLTKNINGTGSINVSGMSGTYYLKNNNTNSTQKVLIER